MWCTLPPLPSPPPPSWDQVFNWTQSLPFHPEWLTIKPPGSSFLFLHSFPPHSAGFLHICTIIPVFMWCERSQFMPLCQQSNHFKLWAIFPDLQNICITTDHNTRPLTGHHHYTSTMCHSLFENLTILWWTRERMSLISQNLHLPINQI